MLDELTVIKIDKSSGGGAERVLGKSSYVGDRERKRV